MAERIYPASKPIPQPPSAQFPAAKSQAYSRRPQPPPKHQRSRCSCCCSFCLFITLILIALILLAAIASGIFYFIYRPHSPEFTVTSFRFSQFNLTSSMALSVTARNPNKKKISFIYDSISVAVFSNGVSIGGGSFPAFVNVAQNITVLKSTVSSLGNSVGSTAAEDVKKKSSTIPLEIELDTKAGIRLNGGMKTKKVGIKVKCDGFDVNVPKNNKAGLMATNLDVSCKVKLRMKIWKWTTI